MNFIPYTTFDKSFFRFFVTLIDIIQSNNSFLKFFASSKYCFLDLFLNIVIFFYYDPNDPSHQITSHFKPTPRLPKKHSGRKQIEQD